jgi:squalene cyclase
VVPEGAFLLRQKVVRQRSPGLYGESKASEEAVERGLDWLAAHQSGNGSWGLHNFHVNCKHPRCGDAGTVTSDPAGTGVALLPSLGAGYTHQKGQHQKAVARALQWLVGRQGPDGTWPAPGDARPMYGHAIAAIALCEAYGMTQDPRLRGPAQKALDYIYQQLEK